MKSPLLYLGFSVVLVLFGALFGPMFIDWSNYREDLQRYGERITGRPVHIGGAVEIRLLPIPMLRVGDVRIANAVGATSPDLVRAGHVEVRLSLTPLLQGKFKVKSLNFDRAVFEIERMAPGQGNWQLHSSGQWEQIISAEDISLEAATVRNGIVFLRDKMRKGVARIDNVDLDISANSLAGPYRIKGGVRYQNIPALMSIATGRFDAKGDMRLSVNLVPEGAARPTYVFDGRLLGNDPKDILEGKLKITRNDKPAIGDGGSDRRAEPVVPFSFTSKVKAGFGRIQLDDMSFYIDQAQSGGAVTGSLTAMIKDTIETSIQLEARHLDFDRIAERVGVKPGDIIPGLDTIGSITQGLDLLPKDFRAKIKFDANALTIGGDTIETATLSAAYADGTLRVGRASGVLPGRSIIVLDDLRFGAQGGAAGLEGDLKFETRDTKGFLRWALPAASAWLDEVPNGFKGASSMTAKIAATDRSVALKETNLRVDGMNVTGSMSVTPGARPSVGANLQIDTFDIDRYVAASGDEAAEGTAPGARNVISAVLPWLDPAQISGFDGNLNLHADKVRRWGRDGSDFNAALDIRNGDLVIRELAVSGLYDMDLAIDGRIGWIGGRPHGRVSAKIDARTPRNLLDIPGLRGHLPVGRNAAARALDAMAPARLRVDIESTESGAASRSTLKVGGFLGLNEVTVRAGYNGDWSRLDAGAVSVDGQITNEEGGLLALLRGGPPEAAGETVKADVIKLSLNGSLEKGIAAVVNAKVRDAELAAKGDLTRSDGAVFVKSDLALKAGDVSALLHALGLTGQDDRSIRAGIDIRGKVAGTVEKFAVSDVKGTVGDTPVALVGKVDLSGDRPRFSGDLSAEKASLPWLLAKLLALPEPVVAAAGGASADPPWLSVPFGLGPLAGLELEMGMQVDELTVSDRATARKASAMIRARDNAVSISGLKARLADGDLAVDLKLSGKADRLAVEGQYRIDTASFAETFSPRLASTPLTGRYTIVGTIEGVGRSPAGLISSLTGSGSLSIQEGSLFGVNPVPFSAALGDASTTPELDALLNTTLTDGEMTFAGFTSAFEIANGVVTFDEANIDGSGASGTVRGYIDLSSWRLDSEWTVGLSEYPEAPALSVVLAGPLATPGRSYDVKELRSFFVVKGLTEGVQRLERLQREEQERIARLQKLEEQARKDKLKRDRERRARLKLEQERLERERRELEALINSDGDINSDEDAVENADDVQTGSTTPPEQPVDGGEGTAATEQPAAVPAPTQSEVEPGADTDTEQVARQQPADADPEEPPELEEDTPVEPPAPGGTDQTVAPKSNKKIQDRVKPTIVTPGQNRRRIEKKTVRTTPAPSEVERKPLVAPPRTQFVPSTPRQPQVSDGEDGPTVQDIDALILKQLEEQALEPVAEGDPVDITPRNQPSGGQTEGSSDTDSNWLK